MKEENELIKMLISAIEKSNPKLQKEQLKDEYKENQILTHNIDVPQRNFNGCFVDVP